MLRLHIAVSIVVDYYWQYSSLWARWAKATASPRLTLRRLAGLDVGLLSAVRHQVDE